MAKDAKGHGSEARGAYGAPVVPGYTSKGAQLLQGVMARSNNPPIVGIPAHQTGVNNALAVQRPLDPDKFKTFLAGAQDKVNQYYAKNYGDSPHMKPPTLEASEGGRYMRIASVERTPTGEIHSRSAHTFVDKTTGDVLKPASWKTPAKGVRGNVHDEHNGLGRMTQFGPEYNR